ncbi:hypothetical protein [Helicobacter cetorum]|uniref:Putative outer membrane protein n=1 Tax=Helicobacter cetorum (strain ATCC BAA-540 / CCUG 52418 / MIT 99-5656) TaxID=1163745 RepID=I0ET29_HELCM|nr:hypothetical protein [Helicobacter cetorum]AFI06098.1 putative outer membrane protein [Helicobacter cetorum MIT 99-5656]
MDVLVDFITRYENKKFLSSLGSFIGLRGLYSNYDFLKQSKNTGNVDLITRINYRHKHPKYSVGVTLPLIQKSIRATYEDMNNTLKSVSLKEGISHFNVFF